MKRLLLVCTAMLLVVPKALAQDVALVIRDVWLWDAGSMQGRASQTIVVRDGRIAAVGPRGAVKVPPGSRVMSGRGLHVNA